MTFTLQVSVEIWVYFKNKYKTCRRSSFVFATEFSHYKRMRKKGPTSSSSFHARCFNPVLQMKQQTKFWEIQSSYNYKSLIIQHSAEAQQHWHERIFISKKYMDKLEFEGICILFSYLMHSATFTGHFPTTGPAQPQSPKRSSCLAAALQVAQWAGNWAARRAGWKRRLWRREVPTEDHL